MIAEPWLGEDLLSWSQSIRNGYARAFILFALHNTGVFEALRNGQAKTSAEIATECQVEVDILEGVLNFLTFSDQVLKKNDAAYALTELGREWLFSDKVIAMSWGAVGAYSSILYELAPALRGEKRYGEDFERNEDYLAVGSFATGKANYPWVVSELSRLGARSVADLGCGSADVLIEFCGLDPHLSGIGVDISPKVLNEARQRVKHAELEDRIRLIQGDLLKPESFKQDMEDVEAFNAIMVFHEFLFYGEKRVVELFRQMKSLFPDRYMFIGEFDRISDEEFEQISLPERIHPLFYQYLIHPLKREGQPTTKTHWMQIFEKAGIEVLQVKDDFPFRLVEFSLKL